MAVLTAATMTTTRSSATYALSPHQDYITLVDPGTPGTLYKDIESLLEDVLWNYELVNPSVLRAALVQYRLCVSVESHAIIL